MRYRHQQCERRSTNRYSIQVLPGAAKMLLAIVVACNCVESTVLGQDPQYELTILDTFPGDSIAHAKSVNNAGQITGYSRAPAEHYRAWIWQKGELTDLGNLGGNAIETHTINEQGHVVGWGGDEDQDWHTLIYIDGVYHDLPTFGGPHIVAMGINETGYVVGHAQTALPDGYYQAYVWDGEEMTNLGTLGGSNSSAYCINSSNIVAGAATNTDILSRAVLWVGTAITELEHDPAYPSSVAYSINDSNVVVGNVGYGESSTRYPVIWIAGEMFYLPQLPGDIDATPIRINQNGDIVGWSQPEWNTYLATLWTDDQVYDLNDLADIPVNVTLARAWDINENGVIVGMAVVDGFARGFMLNPLEPCPGDLNDDDLVNVTDLLILLGNWGTDGEGADLAEPLDIVNVSDLLVLLGAWGECP